MNETMTRKEHLDWCKRRAREYLDRGEPVNAIASMLSDMGKHPENAPAIQQGPLAMLGLMAGRNGVAAARDFIEGFN